ncbi:efflux RND transporter periplasmic adaptor subunit [Thiomicrorhabdus xiamenensis]|uniref:Efflux RND transporter periplasmic adaptor subunit n=1 Tax=Thiomicrorhabdus xiamenensis TaxID=2739063 RepID=A0A7D4TEY7_9GAMM|nr:efflux RND transporter periplasmic adaptor subunit [Thiomicrorhabdus xiamenensis]QKI88388.1 efflux RND transporter periplasmic adaptor subunit [Thiomicrorhabdus xiamenensis]
MSARIIGVLFCALSLNVFAQQDTQQHAHSSEEHNGLDTLGAEESDHASDTLYKYVCPMHPQIIRDHEGTCPICGMALVRQAFEQQSNQLQIASGQSMPGDIKQGFAIRTTRVQNTTLWKYIPTFGTVVADESKVIHVHPRASGWISHLAVRDNGEAVKKGQLLYKVYSPEIVSAQQDFLLALKKSQLRRGGSEILEALKNRLRFLGISGGTIKALEKRKTPYNEIPVYAEQDGVVVNLSVQNGMYVQPQTELMSLQDLSTVWLEAEVLPLQQAWLAEDLTANVTSNAFPGRRWEGMISYIYPVTDKKTQATRVRIPLDNQDGALRPNMLMDVEIFGGPKANVLAIPLEAVIDDGRQKRVVKRLNDNQFEVVEIMTGMQSRDIVEVLSGLQNGQEIVTSGQFLIDSESQIKSNLRRLLKTQ